MDQGLRNRLRNVVTQCRKLLEDSISQELQGKFGIYPSPPRTKDQGPRTNEVHVEDETRMGYLADEDRACRKDLLDHFEHIKALGYKAKDALAQLVREVAFTHLNRLCAYKMMEAREVYVGGQKFREAVSRGLKSQGFLFYLAEHPEDEKRYNSGHQDVAYRHFLDWLGGTLSEEIGVLFSPTDPANRLYPPQRVLDQVLDLLNTGDIKADDKELQEAWPEIWSQDETIGWVYQYFTPKELRDQARKESAAPRNSYELAFRNQFFTPRYVVEFLTDNTLGRIWYEMRKGDTKLKDQCRYMVRRPNEVFLAEGSVVPGPSSFEETKDQGQMTNDQLLKQPVHILHRPKKDPRELKILDPACGSGHFLLYCFDLFQTIYDEAWADSNPPLPSGEGRGEGVRSLRDDYPTLEALRTDVPRLILACNLHGIDIDLRATQIAALSLWLRCQRAYQEIAKDKGPRTKDQFPKITRSNIVCAEPMPGETEMLKEFVADLQPRVLGHLVEVVFDKMKLAGEAGSLLKIEEELREAIAAAKRQWVSEHERAVDRKGQPMLFSRAETERVKSGTHQPQLFDLSEITDEQFWNEAESRVLEALRDYSRHAANGGRLRRKLFAEDAGHGLAFIDVCQRRFQVVLMNPPFGEVAVGSRTYLYHSYDNASQDVFSAFVDRGIQVLEPSGVLGAITSRLAFFLELLEGWRTRLYGQTATVLTLADLGYAVLDDALVEAAAYTVERRSASTHTAVFLNMLAQADKAGSLGDTCRRCSVGECDNNVFLAATSSFLDVPTSRAAYWVSPRWRHLFHTQLCVQSAFGFPYVGLQTGDDELFLRLHWEVPAILMFGDSPRWVSFAKGGEYSPFYGDLHLVLDWSLRDEARRQSNADAYFRTGVTYTERTTSNLSARVLPPGCVFSPNGVTISPREDLALGCAFFLNTRVVQFMLEMCVGSGDAVHSGSAARHYGPRIVARIPVPTLTSKQLSQLNDLTKAIWQELQQRYAAVEPDRYFVHPFLCSGIKESIRRMCQEETSSWESGVARIIQRHYEGERLLIEALSRQWCNL